VYDAQVPILCQPTNVAWQAKFEGCAGWTTEWSPLKSYKALCVEQLTSGDPEARTVEFSCRAPSLPDLSGVRLVISTSEAGFADIDLYDLSGRHVAELAKGEPVSPGTREFTWRRGSAPKGLYCYRVRFGEHLETGKVLVIK
jgi:hypothetical protein